MLFDFKILYTAGQAVLAWQLPFAVPGLWWAAVAAELAGAAVVAAILERDRLVAVNVGDSRAYILRNGELKQLSRDHSRVRELLEAGEISLEEARTHPERSLLTVSLSPKHDEVTPFIAEETVAVGDMVLLCSDGLWSTISRQEIVTAMSELGPQPAARKLVELANTSQGPDNISVIVARLGARARAE